MASPAPQRATFDVTRHVPVGWRGVVYDGWERLHQAGYPTGVIVGAVADGDHLELVIGADWTSHQRVRAIVRATQQAARRTCQVCGRPATRGERGRGPGRIPLCDWHGFVHRETTVGVWGLARLADPLPPSVPEAAAERDAERLVEQARTPGDQHAATAVRQAADRYGRLCRARRSSTALAALIRHEPALVARQMDERMLAAAGGLDPSVVRAMLTAEPAAVRQAGLALLARAGGAEELAG